MVTLSFNRSTLEVMDVTSHGRLTAENLYYLLSRRFSISWIDNRPCKSFPLTKFGLLGFPRYAEMLVENRNFLYRIGI